MSAQSMNRMRCDRGCVDGLANCRTCGGDGFIEVPEEKPVVCEDCVLGKVECGPCDGRGWYEENGVGL